MNSAPTFTPRQRDIIAAILAGCTTRKQLSAALMIEVGTVKGHMEEIFKRAGVGSVADLVLWLWRTGYEVEYGEKS